MDDMAEMLALRNRVMRRVYHQMTPEERVRRARELNEWSMARLAANPAGWDNFIRRNLAKRAIPVPHDV